jgi:hypothetical protein
LDLATGYWHGLLPSCNEAISATRYGFDESWGFCRVTESFAHSFDRIVNTVIKIYEGVGGPDTPLEFLARNESAGGFKKYLKNLQRLLLQADSCAAFTQLS